MTVLVLGLAACGSSSQPAGIATRASAGSPANVPRIKVKLGPCPVRFPRVKLATLNRRAPARDTTLVAFDASSVRVCSYSFERLGASGILTSTAAAELERATNALPAASAPITCPAASRHASRRFLVTFDDTVQRVHVQATDACGGGVTNGVVTATATRSWASAVVRAATKPESPPAPTG